ncbi:hypothetical protein [Pseudoxanthomonas dokdonensis]|uniref:hypothetical protein n=1 Tax=Pseudoxanthomonas dokdonensis TaxID=344882 RepID=UPI0012ED8539|nr:hypothetical protein [Pseudoxanthomonas dokdonensis]
MNKQAIRQLTLATLLGLGLAVSAQAQTVGYNFRTGDAWVDNRLYEINDYGARYRDPFVREMTGNYGAPRSLVEDLFGRNWSAGDIYYACAIAHIVGIPCLDVVNDYDRNRGQGWGAVAKRMGIKPGSPEFHSLKNGFSRTYDHWGYPVAVDQNVHVDWSKHGPGNSGNAGKSGNSGKPDNPGHSNGHSGKPAQSGSAGSKGGGNGKGNSSKGNNGNGKGNGKH